MTNAEWRVTVLVASVVLADGVGLVDDFAVWSDVAVVLGDVVLG